MQSTLCFQTNISDASKKEKADGRGNSDKNYTSGYTLLFYSVFYTPTAQAYYYNMPPVLFQL